MAITFAAAVIAAWPAAATELYISARFVPEAGRIADAALVDSSHLMLLYPGENRIADYSLNGSLNQHIIREGGSEWRFKPMVCAAGPANTFFVFDEATHKVFEIGTDGNFAKGVDLVFPLGDGSATVLSKIGGLSLDISGSFWTLLPERGVLAGFTADGNYLKRLDLAAALPYELMTFSRAQHTPGGSLYVMDYHQGAIFRRPAGQAGFNRIALGLPEGIAGAPTVQDFAVDDGGNLLLATYDEVNPLLLLAAEQDGYRSHSLELDLSGEGRRLACRFSGGKYIVWQRDEPLVIVLELR